MDALVKRDLEEPFWTERLRLRQALFTEFESRTSDREKANENGWLNGLNVNGDHTLLMRGILEDLENWWKLTPDSNKELASTVLPKGTLYETLRMYIDDRIWGQDRRTSGSAEQDGEGDQPLPPGWRRIERDGQVIYLHENGQRQRRRPVEDADLVPGWVKLATSRPDVFIYHHAGTNMTKETRPAADDHLIPQGWEKVPSRGSVTVPFYYRHKAMGEGSILQSRPEAVLLQPEHGRQAVREARGGSPRWVEGADLQSRECLLLPRKDWSESVCGADLTVEIVRDDEPC
eukprot:CAMPEP_0177502114 /NCGR_PEP_ID=MMETSP0369-20130122/37598_1 /TAXON_ID=447022 ORGANISM="Scrippsiella hangoei-like, Strain SHHI-4" /NCGR_SAMPLE_ID=MMETSP0369 /ASSEMBLY_ACC=CAM_ASM_000364 /LENGTH=288 /DNA_ID=CAMNT_0018979691 /DNA_START=1 /DNA_END=867 /DNA_ORIENTATION=+